MEEKRELLFNSNWISFKKLNKNIRKEIGFNQYFLFGIINNFHFLFYCNDLLWFGGVRHFTFKERGGSNFTRQVLYLTPSSWETILEQQRYCIPVLWQLVSVVLNSSDNVNTLCHCHIKFKVFDWTPLIESICSENLEFFIERRNNLTHKCYTFLLCIIL